jgi:hypothetical protein
VRWELLQDAGWHPDDELVDAVHGGQHRAVQQPPAKQRSSRVSGSCSGVRHAAPLTRSHTRHRTHELRRPARDRRAVDLAWARKKSLAKGRLLAVVRSQQHGRTGGESAAAAGHDNGRAGCNREHAQVQQGCAALRRLRRHRKRRRVVASHGDSARLGIFSRAQHRRHHTR